MAVHNPRGSVLVLIGQNGVCVCVCDIQVGHRCGSRNTPVGQEADLEVYLRISGEGVC